VKTVLIAVLALFILIAFEGQGGASASSPGGIFDVVRSWRFAGSNPNPSSLRVMTWNIDHGAKLDRIVTGIAANPADLCLLQEVDWNTARTGERDVGAELARRLRLNGSYGIEFEELSQGHAAYIGQATLTRLPVRRSRVLRFERQSGFWKPHGWIPSSIPFLQRRLGNRIALVTELDFNGKLLVVYNAHLESRSAGFIQEHQLDEIVQDAGQYPSSTLIIVGGDLNTKYLPSLFLRKLERDGFQSALGERVERTHRIAMALDWIFTKGPVELSGGSARRDIKGSDHYPVYTVLSVVH
jgi:endonuclease/exonuclease/phosphatase family metal-dependent hydrolase